VALASIVYLLHRSRGIEDAAPDPRKIGAQQIALRGMLGGCIVGGVVILSTISGPMAGAVLGSAPTIWPTSLYVANRTHSLEFSRSLTKSFLRTGLITIIPYFVAARYLFPLFGMWWGTLLSYVVISPLAWLSWKLSGAKTTMRGSGVQSLDLGGQRGWETEDTQGPARRDVTKLPI